MQELPRNNNSFIPDLYDCVIKFYPKKEEENFFFVNLHNHFRNVFCRTEYLEMAGTHILISDQNLYGHEDK